MDTKKFSTFSLVVVIIIGVAFVYLFVVQRLNSDGDSSLNYNFNIFGNQQPNDQNQAGDLAFQRFGSYGDFVRFLEEDLVSSSGNVAFDSVGFGMIAGVAETRALIAPQAEDSSAMPSGSGSAGYSGTNVQVAGVDEADMVKSDGEYLYIASGRSVQIVDAYPPSEAGIVSSVDLNSPVNGLYINNDTLVVYGLVEQGVYSEVTEDRSIGIVPLYQTAQSYLKTYDVSDHANPRLIREVVFDGYPVQSRMVSDTVYFITSRSQYDFLNGPYPLPRIIENGSIVSGDPARADSSFPAVYYLPYPYSNAQQVSVSAVNVRDGESPVATQVFMLDGSQNIYASADNVYITYTKYLDEFEVIYDVIKSHLLSQVSSEDQSRISLIEQTPDFVLNQYEKMQKVMAILERHILSLSRQEQESLRQTLELRVRERMRQLVDDLEKTVIHKIGIEGGSISYQGFGEVPGYVLNQFSMDESGGYFRIATTRGQLWSSFIDDSERESYSNIYVLDEAMKVVGSIERLAMGERIYSARFMQGRAYLVTFEQVDPLFVVDLSEPTSPRVLGELKIPGFSTYLHPLNDSTLIGFGRDTELQPSGSVALGGLKLALFNVSDVSNPVEQAQFIIGTSGVYSPALDDHKAFLYAPAHELLVIPVNGSYVSFREFPVDDVPGEDVVARDGVSGAYVFHVTPESIELQGVIEHTPVGSDTEKLGYWANNVKRSLYIEDTLYTLSEVYLKMNSIDDLADSGTVAIPYEPNYYGRPVPFPMPVDMGIPGVMTEPAEPTIDF